MWLSLLVQRRSKISRGGLISMTENQINYYRAYSEREHNRNVERETERTNRANEAIREAANLESLRHNVASEELSRQANANTRYYNEATIANKQRELDLQADMNAFNQLISAEDLRRKWTETQNSFEVGMTNAQGALLRGQAAMQTAETGRLTAWSNVGLNAARSVESLVGTFVDVSNQASMNKLRKQQTKKEGFLGMLAEQQAKNLFFANNYFDTTYEADLENTRSETRKNNATAGSNVANTFGKFIKGTINLLGS